VQILLLRRVAEVQTPFYAINWIRLNILAFEPPPPSTPSKYPVTLPWKKVWIFPRT